jgi:hypothetical protein
MYPLVAPVRCFFCCLAQWSPRPSELCKPTSRQNAWLDFGGARANGGAGSCLVMADAVSCECGGKTRNSPRKGVGRWMGQRGTPTFKSGRSRKHRQPCCRSSPTAGRAGPGRCAHTRGGGHRRPLGPGGSAAGRSRRLVGRSRPLLPAGGPLPPLPPARMLRHCRGHCASRHARHSRAHLLGERRERGVEVKLGLTCS